MARNLVRARGPKSHAHLLHKLTFGSYNSAFKPNRTDFDWLSRDTAVVDAYVADPRCGFVCTNALYVDLIGGLARVNDRKTMKGTGKKLAILVLTGSMDPAGGERAALALKAFYKGIGNKHVQVNTYKGARHEVYNDTNRGSVVHDLVGWLDGRLAKRKAS